MDNEDDVIVAERADTVESSTQIFVVPNYGSSAAGLHVAAPSDIEIGTGYDFLVGGWKRDFNAALVRSDGNGITDDDPAMATNEDLRQTNNYVTVSNETSYSQSLSASASASASYWGFKVSGSVSALMKSKASATSVTTLAQTLIGTKTCVLQKYSDTRISDAARKRLLTGRNGETLKTPNEFSLEMFIERYGTHYVEGYSYGGSFNGLVTVNTSSTEDRDEVAASLKVAGYGGDFDANYTKQVDKLSESHSVTVSSESIGAFTEPAFNMAGLLAANGEFKKNIDPQNKRGGGGVRIVAHVVPWGNAAPFTELVPHDLIDRYLLFGSVNEDSLGEAREAFNFLSYVQNCVHAYREDYAPGGAWALYLSHGAATVLDACNALDAPLLEANTALKAVSLRDLAQDKLPESLTKPLGITRDRWKELQEAIRALQSSRQMIFRFYDTKGVEQKDVVSNPFGGVVSYGRDVAFQTQQLDRNGEIYEFPTQWTSMHDSRCGCYFRIGSETKFLSNTDRGELQLMSKSLKKGPLTVAWYKG